MKHLLTITKYLVFIAVLSVQTISHAQETNFSIDVLSLAIEKAERSSSSLSGNKTTLELKLKTDNEIVKIIKQGTKLTSFTDETGTDLLKNGIKWRRQQSYFTTGIENDVSVRNSWVEGDSVYFSINVTSIPAKGTKTITVEADIALHCYPKDKVETTNSGLLALSGGLGTVFFSDFQVNFREYGTGRSNSTELTYISIDTDAIVERFKFLDVTGKELKVVDYPSHNSPIKVESSLLFNVAQVSVEYMAPVVVNIPVKFTTGLGI